ncbi:uncharacterized protein LOC116686341 isoform X2 [Etheostoma spectabile]|uniref:uncharacterized protein LOC116686341 isoform X2 n=1 Tax=Etheostoma spectabile TaxID=54343 RepID=UPI0013AFC74F|nr:uncharacterized protein LOC116686341 isoform X2 [Etheostoma spectabile]
MNNVGHRVRCRRPTVPPFSNRTLHHPSFLPVYMATESRHHTDCNNQTVQPIIPAEFFYTDPTMSCGRRIPNKVFDCFQLNTPPPVMSACPAPPTRPDPFRSEAHPTRDLGNLTLKRKTIHPPVQSSRVILQLTQEEDQAITNLLKLHHQQPIQSDKTLAALQMVSSSVELNPISFLHPDLMDSTSAEEVYKPFCSDEQYSRQQGKSWSDLELEAANALLSCLMEEEIWGQNHSKSALTLSDPLLFQHHKDSSIRTETPKGSESFSALTVDCTQNNTDHIGFSCARDYREPGWGGFGFVMGRSDVHLPVCESSMSSDSKAKNTSGAFGNFLEIKERMLSDSEGDAVEVLLSLRDMGALDTMQ